MSDDRQRWLPRTFKPGVTYRSEIYTDGGGLEETFFVVVKPSDKHWNPYSNPPVQYWALNLYTGEKFEFHRDSIVAENAKELFK